MAPSEVFACTPIVLYLVQFQNEVMASAYPRGDMRASTNYVLAHCQESPLILKHTVCFSVTTWNASISHRKRLFVTARMESRVSVYIGLLGDTTEVS